MAARDPAGNPAPSGGFKTGGWYSGFQYWNGSFAPRAGMIHPQSNQQGAGQAVAPEVRAASAAQQGVSEQQFNEFINQQNQISANQIQAPVSVPTTSGATQQFTQGLTAEVERARNALQSNLAGQQAKNEAEMKRLREREAQALEGVKGLTTPFREDLEMSERERLYVNQNFEENQKLVDELDSLLTEGNELIRQQQEVTGLAAVRNPRIQKTMNDVAARAGVIEAVINARNGQIAQAYNMIDRSINAITQDRLDQLSYYETVLNLTNRDIISLDEDSKRIAQEEVNILKSDLNRAQETVDYIKQLMVNPDTALLMGDAGVTLGDSIEQINGKLSEAQYRNEIRDLSNEMATSGYSAVVDPGSVPASQLVTITDRRGNQYHYRKTSSTSSGFSTSDFLSNLTDLGYEVDGGGIDTQQQVNVDLLWDEVLNNTNATYAGKPNFTPAGGPGTVWTDSTGTRWIYTNAGWRKS